MNEYKEALIKYNKDLIDRDEAIQKVVSLIEEELKDASTKSYYEAKDMDKKINEAPCSVCGSLKFVLKYRDVSGKTTGRISGSFSFFCGSISGYIDGEVHTDPILSCRNCENERKIVLSSWRSKEDIWECNLPSMYSYGLDSKPSDWLKSKGLEVAKEVDKTFYHFNKDYKNLKDFTDKRLIATGLQIKYPLPIKPRWYNYLFT